MNILQSNYLITTKVDMAIMIKTDYDHDDLLIMIKTDYDHDDLLIMIKTDQIFRRTVEGKLWRSTRKA